jgi:hypothetical protein
VFQYLVVLPVLLYQLCISGLPDAIPSGKPSLAV